MTGTAAETRSVIIEREIAFPPEKIWRALTTPHFIAEWLMQNDFAAEIGHRFSLRQEWGAIDCTVLEVDPHRNLSYSWAAMGLESQVTWTLVPTAFGTLLRMEHAGFAADQNQAYQGARLGWRRFIGQLEALLDTLD